MISHSSRPEISAVWILVTLCIALPVRAELVVYEPFDYPDGDLRGENGGAGDWTSAWFPGVGFGSGHSWEVAQPSLGYTDSGGRALVTTGRSVEADGGEHRETRSWNTAGHKDDGDIVWFSFLFRRADELAGTGHHIFIVGKDHMDGMGVFMNPTSISARINNQNIGAPSSGAGSFTIDENHFVVGRITFSNTVNDEVRIWLDPELNEAPLDTAATSSTSLAVDASSWSNLYIRKFGSGVSLLDEFRIGTDFFSVAAAVPEPSSVFIFAAAGLMTLAGQVLGRRDRRKRSND